MDELVLASGSPRRAELLRQLGLRFQVVVPHVDETVLSGESARDYVVRIASDKMSAVRSRATDNSAVILCADTIVVLDSEILGKPVNEEEALTMLMNLSGRSHRVLTAVRMHRGESSESFISETLVTFRQLNLEECRDYCATGEPMDKAGAYGAQGRGAIFIEQIAGSYSNVVGLPLTETALALRRMGIDCLKDA